MKVCLFFVLAGLAFASGWIFYEKPRPILLLRRPTRLAALNLPRGRAIGNGRVGRHVPLNEPPSMCLFQGPCNQIYRRNRFELKNLFEAAPLFRNNYESLYPRRMKGRQVPPQSRGGFAPRNSLVYMTPNLMIVRPVSASRELPPRYSGFREILYSKPIRGQESKPETPRNESQVLFQAVSEKPKMTRDKIIPVVESKRTFTEVSSQEPKTYESSFRDARPSSVRQYAVKEVIDEGQPPAGRFAGKALFVPNAKEDTTAEARRKTNSRIVKIIPLAEGNKIGKSFQTVTSYPAGNDQFLRIIPSQSSQGFNQKTKELPVNRKELSKNLKVTPNRQESATEVTADSRPESRFTPAPTVGVKNRDNFREVEVTPAAVDSLRQSTTPEVTYFSPANPGYMPKPNHKGSLFTAEREFKPQQTPSPKSGKQAVPPLKTAATPEVTFTVLEAENATDVPEEVTVTLKSQTPTAFPTAREDNTTGYAVNATTTEGFTEHPLNSDFLTSRADVKKESFLKNSRKMHFGQESRPEESSDKDQRRSDILISDNFDDYFDEEVNLSYLEKLKRNNSLGSLRDVTSNTLIPLIPMVIQDLRQGKIPPEDISLLSTAFGDRWKTVLELSNSTNLDMLPILKMKDESDLKNVLQSITYSVEPTTTEATFTIDYEHYDYMDKFKDLYDDLLTVGQEIEGDKNKGATDTKRTGNVSEKIRAKRQG